MAVKVFIDVARTFLSIKPVIFLVKMPDWESQFKVKGRIWDEPDPQVIEFAKTLEKGSRILDLGCGTGRHLVYLAGQGFEMYGTDISSAGIQECKKWLREKGLKAKLEVEDFEKISYPDEFFDAVISTKTIHHGVLKKIKNCVEEIYRVTKKGGKILVTLVHKNSMKWKKGYEIEKDTLILTKDRIANEIGIPHHFFDEESVKDLFHKFKLIKVETIGGYKNIRKKSHVLFIGEKI